MKKDIFIYIAVGILLIWLLRKPVQTGIDMTKKALSRGYRNNNPGNIVLTFDNKGNKTFWKGEIEGDDKRFKTFKDIFHGYRAIFITLNSYINKGFNTIEKILNRYAPPSENQTNSYISTVSKLTGIPETEPVSFKKADDILRIVYAISYVENGVYPDNNDIMEGYKLFKLS